MNGTEQAILFVVGLAFLIVGLGLSIYGVVQKRTVAGAADTVSPILDSIANLFKEVANLVGPYRASGIGIVLVLVGLALIFVPLFFKS
jgi:hypothetical protein